MIQTFERHFSKAAVEAAFLEDYNISSVFWFNNYFSFIIVRKTNTNEKNHSKAFKKKTSVYFFRKFILVAFKVKYSI